MSETTTAADPVKTYRGESIAELLTQIRAELGPGAVIVRQREGLVGGVGGFFQKRCVEVDARPGEPGIDVYDEPADAEGLADAPSAGPLAAGDPPAEEPPLIRNDAATREGLATPAVQELVSQAEPFAEMLVEYAEPAAEAEPEPLGPPRADLLRKGLAASGLGEDLAAEVVDSVLASAMPFVNAGRLRTLVRNQLALRVPVAEAAAPGPRTLVMVGPAGAGKTTAIATIAAAHAAAGAAVRRTELDRPPRAGEAAAGLLLVDTPPLWGGAAGLEQAAARLAALERPEVHLVIRAGTAAAAAAELLEGLAALAPSRLLITGAAETSHLGGVLDLAIRSRTPLGYVAESPGEIALADPRELATRVTP